MKPEYCGRHRQPCQPGTHTFSAEARLSDCESGCKIYRCGECGTEGVVHSVTYGCKITTAA